MESSVSLNSVNLMTVMKETVEGQIKNDGYFWRKSFAIDGRYK